MVLGIGIDIIEIERVKKSMDNPLFIDRIYTKQEQLYLKSRNNNPSTAAGYFAAKEAAAKALGTGISVISWTDIEILRFDNGKPDIKLYGKAKEIMDRMGGSNILLSISHSRDNAIAQVVIC
ncbi:MAG: holo-ACP synthase [Clostridiales bacterium]|nr:holo-ACP synthase [Clostridiales bacterium]